jgi:transcriptional repressor NrdR
VVKRDGRREPFDRKKILAGVLKACEKRPIPMERIEGLVDEVERQLRQEFDTEVGSIAIGERVMQRLHALDEVAYVRFASVYRSFKDLDQFMRELRLLLSQKAQGRKD